MKLSGFRERGRIRQIHFALRNGMPRLENGPIWSAKSFPISCGYMSRLLLLHRSELREAGRFPCAVPPSNTWSGGGGGGDSGCC